MKIMSPEETLRVTLAALQSEHRRLDEEVARRSADPTTPSLDLQRMKRRKLALKDRIEALKDRLNPDIIA